MSLRPLAAATVAAMLLAQPCGMAFAADDATIKSLDKKTVDVRPGKIILDSSELARESYRDFLDLVSSDPELQAEAMRRLADLELEASEVEQLTRNVEALDVRSFDNAVGLYQRLLEAYPDYRRNDTVLYQLARAYEVGGRTDEALEVLNELVARYPRTSLLDEVQFRRGEMLFLRKRFNDAEVAYQAVMRYGDASPFYEQSLYKLGWSQFKLAWYEESLAPFFGLLDRRIAGMRVGEGDERLSGLSRAERELVEDTFRVLSIVFSYLEGAQSIDEYFARSDLPSYAHVIYGNLGDLYLEKERYQDAAQAYEAYVSRDPYHAMSPVLQARAIEAYNQGGFQALVLQGKKNFVSRYGMDGQFWMRNPRSAHQTVVQQLKENLNDLAQFYHAAAQQGRKADDYREAANWYRKYLAYFPEDPDAANTNFLLAEILFESGDYDAATGEYERTSYSYPVHAKSAEAGYAAILAYRAHEEMLEGVMRDTWRQQYMDSGLRFASVYPEHPESGAVLTTIAEELFADDRFDMAIAVGKKVVTKQPPVTSAQARTAWTVIAHSNFDLANFEAAENAYYSVRNVTPADDLAAREALKERIASSIYKQGEMARNAGAMEAAVRHFMRLGRAVPDSPIRMTAEYDAAAALINLQAWDRAATVLEQFRGNYPDSEFTDDVTQKLAVVYLEGGRPGRAAAEFERIAAAASSSDDVRRDALWQSSELYEKAGRLADEKRVLNRIVARYPNPLSESIEARARLAEIARLSGNDAERIALLEGLIQVDATAGSQRSDRTRFLAATASLELAEPVRKRFDVVKLSQPLAASMKLKTQLMQDVIAAYTTAADYGVAEVTTASTFHLGSVYEQFSSDLLSSARPADLDADALEQYEILLEEQAFPFEEKAIDLYKANTDRAAGGIYDEWVSKSFERLAGLMPARYAKKERSEDVVTALY